VDLATLIGILAGFGVMLGAILMGPSAGIFLNPPSLVIVIGGTTAAVMMKFSMGQFIGAFGVAGKVFTHKAESPEELIEVIEDLAVTARKEGLLALEGKEINNEFLKKGVSMMVDGHGPEVIRSVLSKDMSQAVERHDVGQKIFKGFGDYAPAMGMIGTLIGLVQMLSNMDDPKSIGPAMAVALLTTLYGAMIANLVALPISEKLALRSVEEKRTKSMIIDGLGGIQAGLNPRVISEMLATYLPTKKRKSE
jgi:chemotaxis protein MotA